MDFGNEADERAKKAEIRVHELEEELGKLNEELRLRPSTQKILTLAAEVKTLKKDKEHLRINLSKAEEEVKILFEENNILDEANKRLVRQSREEKNLHDSGRKHTGSASAKTNKRKSSPKICSPIEKKINFTETDSTRKPLSPFRYNSPINLHNNLPAICPSPSKYFLYNTYIYAKNPIFLLVNCFQFKVTSSEEEEGSSTEEDDEEDPKTQSSPLIQKSRPTRKPDSESESDTAVPIIKPIAIATKPMKGILSAKKCRSSKPLASLVRASSSKRAGEFAKEVKLLKKKVRKEGLAIAPVVEEVKKTGEDAKKLLFQRLFSEDDEIALLKSMLAYSAKKGADPCADMNGFYDFVKKLIHIDVTKAQMMDKLKDKGEDRTFSKAHEQNAFELSKNIWGKEGISGKVESSTDKKIDELSKSFDSLLDKRFGVFDMEVEVVEVGLDMVDGEKKTALEAKWRKLQMVQLAGFVE
ncbi:hypothetical protein GOBAR_DD08027 [Gossypium barbadense]|nr:hypothetical protein GOBAR_DD08027 [Gossypium barbadense]